MWITQLLALVTLYKICSQYTCTGDLLQPCSDEGKWGYDCGKVCNHCLGGCDRDNGQCDQCQHGRYGLNCALICSNDCGITVEVRACNRKSGKCNSGCSHDKYGPYCNNTCDSKCLNGHCDFQTGDCVDCADGFMGENCKYECTSSLCECQKCQKSDGKCLCCKPPATHVTGTPSTNPVCDQNGGDTKTVIIVTVLLVIFMIFILAHVPVYYFKGMQIWVDSYENLRLGVLRLLGWHHYDRAIDHASQKNNASEDKE